MSDLPEKSYSPRTAHCQAGEGIEFCGCPRSFFVNDVRGDGQEGAGVAAGRTGEAFMRGRFSKRLLSPLRRLAGAPDPRGRRPSPPRYLGRRREGTGFRAPVERQADGLAADVSRGPERRGSDPGRETPDLRPREARPRRAPAGRDRRRLCREVLESRQSEMGPRAPGRAKAEDHDGAAASIGRGRSGPRSGPRFQQVRIDPSPGAARTGSSRARWAGRRRTCGRAGAPARDPEAGASGGWRARGGAARKARG